ncbi:hypothetical protein C8R47DRAFT_1077415 [Mycena vitilis]|nr:hypothetical protein C8R47DRAFT_1077415 [Mycena vitilis]
MDPNHGVQASYDVTSSGYNPDLVTPSGYNPDLVTPSGYPDNGFAQNPSEYSPAPNAHEQNTLPANLDNLHAVNQLLLQQIEQMKIGYHSNMSAEMQAFTDSVKDDFAAVQAQRDAAQTEKALLAAQVAATLARLEAIESASKARAEAEAERAARAKEKTKPSKATPSKRTPSSAAKEPPATPKPSADRRRSKAPADSQSTPSPSPKPPRPSAKTSRASSSTNPPRASPDPRRASSSTDAPRASPKPRPSGSTNRPRASPDPPRASSSTDAPRASPKPRPSANPSGSSANGARTSSGSPPSASSSNGKGKNAAKPNTPRKVAEYQMLNSDIPIEARAFKHVLQLHIRFLSGILESTRAESAKEADVKHFCLRTKGFTVTQLRRMGEIGDPIIDPAQVKVGVSVEDAIHSRNNIIRAFFQLEESAILHIKCYLAKLGLSVWAVDFTQSPYSMYNTAMRMCAIDTFRFMLGATYYDFLHPDTRYVNDPALMTKIYDHFVHVYLFKKWKLEMRAEGSNKLNAERNKASQARLRLYKRREGYLKDSKIPKRLQLLFAAKATSDDESTPQGPCALARPERSEDADAIIRALDRLQVEDLLADGKKRAANNCERRRAAPFGQRNSGYFQEVPKKMPIQYYQPEWFNNRPPQARRKIAPQLTVVFPPGTRDFFSRRGDNLLSQAQMTEKFGALVFDAYDLDFGNAEAEASGEGVGAGAGVDADDEGEGDEVGSEDSEESEASDTGSVESFVVDDDGASGGEDAYGDKDEDDSMGGSDTGSDASSDAGSDAGSDDKQDNAEDDHQGGAWDGRAGFAAEYDVDMSEDEGKPAFNPIFDGSDSDD